MIAQADAVRIPLPSKSVHCCVTSPPYWGLRKYAGEQGEEPLGLEATPERHVERIVKIFREVKRVLRDDGTLWLNYGDCYYNHRPGAGSALPSQTLAGGISGKGGDKRDQPDFVPRRANKQEIGSGSLMMMPHRVALALQADGWIVRQDLVWYKKNPMPESLAGTRWVKHRIKVNPRPEPTPGTYGAEFDHGLSRQAGYRDEGGLTAKYEDCPGCEKCIPNNGLVLKRGSWRHTRAHEYVFMLTKKMQYWSNQEAVRENLAPESAEYFEKYKAAPRTMTFRDKEQIDRGERNDYFGGGRGAIMTAMNPAGRNPRSVLDVPTAPYKGAHYATFPPNLIAPLIRATCPRWACPVCGQGWAAVVEDRGYSKHRPSAGDDPRSRSEDKQALGSMGGHHGWQGNNLLKNTPNVSGYKPTCEHNAPHDYFLSPTEHLSICVVCKRLKVDIEKDGGACSVPGIVFDPFLGSGTTVKVAQDLLRKGIGIDISMEYLDLQAKVRIGQGSPSNVLDDLPLFQ